MALPTAEASTKPKKAIIKQYRGRMILEDLMLDLMYFLPSYKKVKEFQVTREMVLTQKISLTLLEKAG